MFVQLPFAREITVMTLALSTPPMWTSKTLPPQSGPQSREAGASDTSKLSCYVELRRVVDDQDPSILRLLV